MHTANNRAYDKDEISLEEFKLRRKAINTKFSSNYKIEKKDDKILDKVKFIEVIKNKNVKGQITIQEYTSQILKLKHVGNDEIQKVSDIILGNVKLFKEIEEKYNNGLINL